MQHIPGGHPINAPLHRRYRSAEYDLDASAVTKFTTDAALRRSRRRLAEARSVQVRLL